VRHAPTLLGVSLKMYMGHADTLRWCERIAAVATGHPAVTGGAAQLFVLPDFTSIQGCLTVFAGGPVAVGAQDLSWADAGALTGEVSGATLAELGCRYAEVGHAERRRLLGETDEVVAAKTVAALRNGLTPVLCVGEADRTSPDRAAETCIRELATVLAAADAEAVPAELVVAYEPHWAIGADEPASADHIQAVCRSITGWLAGRPSSAGSRVIYGGSAGPGLLTRLGTAVDGLFLGRFAHDPSALVAVLDEVATTVGAPS
jgi:triosephosphate isomerase (TIM)